MKRKIIYLVLTIIFIIISSLLIVYTDMNNNVMLSRTIEIVLILFLIKLSIGCIFRIKKIYEEHKYSYSIITNLGLVIFLNINILRLINLVIENWTESNIISFYNNTLESFSFFAMLTMPLIIILSLYSIISNLVLIKKEGFSYNNLFGIVLGVFALFGILGTQLIYLATKGLTLSSGQLVVKKFLDISINAVLSYLYSIILASLYCNFMAAKHVPKYDKDYVIILGCKIGKDGSLTPLLKGRVDKAISFSKKQKEETNKDIIFIPSGGQGHDEVISESLAIKKYLTENNIDEKNIILEDKSTSTKENILFSKKKINELMKDGKIAFSTTNYHVFRSGVIASNVGVDCEGMGSKTKWYFYSNALIREFIASLYNNRKQHLFLIVSINIALFILVFIGYHLKFFSI